MTFNFWPFSELYETQLYLHVEKHWNVSLHNTLMFVFSSSVTKFMLLHRHTCSLQLLQSFFTFCNGLLFTFCTCAVSGEVMCLPLKNLMMSVKSMLFSRMMSLYISTSARAMKRTKWLEETCLAAQMVSQTVNTSSYTSSEAQNATINGHTVVVRTLFFFLSSPMSLSSDVFLFNLPGDL